MKLWPCGSVGWSIVLYRKGCGFDFCSGRMPRFCLDPPLGAFDPLSGCLWEAANQCFSLSLSLSLPSFLSESNEKNILRWGFKKKPTNYIKVAFYPYQLSKIPSLQPSLVMRLQGKGVFTYFASEKAQKCSSQRGRFGDIRQSCKWIYSLTQQSRFWGLVLQLYLHTFGIRLYTVVHSFTAGKYCRGFECPPAASRQLCICTMGH